MECIAGTPTEMSIELPWSEHHVLFHPHHCHCHHCSMLLNCTLLTRESIVLILHYFLPGTAYYVCSVCVGGGYLLLSVVVAGSACKMWSRCLLWAAASESSGVAPVLGAAADTGDHWLLQWHTRAESVVSAVSSWVSPAVECAAVCSVVTPAAAASFPVDIEQAECLSTSLSCTTLSLVKWAAVDDDRKQRFKLSTLI